MSLTLYYDTFRCTGEMENPPELLMIHGWGMHSLVWDPVMPALLKRFQVTVIDLPGLGRSPMPGGEYDLDYLVQHVMSVAPANAVWCGWSLGGIVAMKAALEYPERVAALITVASSPCFVAREDWPVAMSPDVLEAFQTLLLEDAEGTLIRFLSLQCKGSETQKADIRQLRELLFFHGLPARKALREGLNILRDTDFRQSLSMLKCPTLHVYGEHDHLVPVGVSAAMRELQPDAEVAVIKGVSHIPFLSAAELFMSACNDFFDQHRVI